MLRWWVTGIGRNTSLSSGQDQRPSYVAEHDFSFFCRHLADEHISPELTGICSGRISRAMPDLCVILPVGRLADGLSPLIRLLVC